MEIAAAIVVMGHSLRLTVLAEGVETGIVAVLKQQQGCDYYQGYLYSLPLPAEEFAQLLSQQNQPVPPVYVEQLRVSAQIA